VISLTTEICERIPSLRAMSMFEEGKHKILPKNKIPAIAG
jgi:hypothetical protein